MSLPGNEELLKDVCAQQREKLLQTDIRGWCPLHQAAAQSNQRVLELVFTGWGSLVRTLSVRGGEQ